MANYTHLKLLVLLFWAGCLVRAEDQHEGETLHRSKRTLTTICVEIKPSGPQEEPYYMCKGADFRGEQPPNAPAPATVVPGYQQVTPMATFPSFPAFGGGFFPIQPVYEEPTKVTPTSSYQDHSAHSQPKPPTPESYAAPAPSPASAAQSYGLPTVPYPGPGGTSTASRGASAGPGPEATPLAYNPAAAKKASPITKVAPSKTSAPTYESSVDGNRYRSGLDEDVLAMPNVGFHPAEFNQRYRTPLGEPQQPMIWLPQPQPVLGMPKMAEYYDDPVMRSFYGSLQPTEPQVGAVHQPERQKKGEYLGHASYSPNYPQSSTPESPPPAPPVYPMPELTVPTPSTYDSSCNSCSTPPASARQCPAHQESVSCPSFQPVIIAMPCYGQQQPTHYLAVPNNAASSPVRGQTNDNAYGMNPQIGSPFGMNPLLMGNQFGMSQPAYHMQPQLGGPFNPQVGAPFGMPALMNPFGPFGSLNPFNPFNRILGASVSTPSQPTKNPLQRLFTFAGQEDGVATTEGPKLTSPVNQQSLSSSTMATPSSEQPADGNVGAANDNTSDEDELDEEEPEDEQLAPTTEASASADSHDIIVSKSAESSGLTAMQYVDKAADKLKIDKRKRHNSRSSSSNNPQQKRKYLQRL